MHCAEIAALNFSDHSLLHPLCSWSTCSVRRRARLCRVCGRWCRAAMRPRGPHALPTSGVIVAGACLMLCSIPCQHRAHALMCVTVQAACHTVAGRASIGTPCSQLPNSRAPRMSSWTQQQRPSGASVVFRCRCCRSDGSMNCQLACACLSRAVNLCIKHLMRVLLSCRLSSKLCQRPSGRWCRRQIASVCRTTWSQTCCASLRRCWSPSCRRCDLSTSSLLCEPGAALGSDIHCSRW